MIAKWRTSFYVVRSLFLYLTDVTIDCVVYIKVQLVDVDIGYIVIIIVIIVEPQSPFALWPILCWWIIRQLAVGSHNALLEIQNLIGYDITG